MGRAGPRVRPPPHRTLPAGPAETMAAIVRRLPRRNRPPAAVPAKPLARRVYLSAPPTLGPSERGAGLTLE